MMLWGLLAVAILLVVLAYVWMFRSLAWINQHTLYDDFFSLTLDERRALRETIQKKARWIRLLVTPPHPGSSR